MTSHQRRHVWVDTAGGQRQPGLVIAWRRTDTGTWEAQVATARSNSMLLTWTPVAHLHPVTDDCWQNSRN